MAETIIVENLSVKFGDHVALDNLNLKIEIIQSHMIAKLY